MLTVACAALLLAQEAAAAQDPAAFATLQNVLETDRIALTPKLDGVIEASEWDPFATSNGSEVYLQWEPHRLHAAGTLSAGQELVVSLDRKGDGWLVGNDNLELRLIWAEGKPVLRARWLDATDRSGPRWVEAPEFEKAAMYAGAAGEKVVLELTAVDPGLDFLPDHANTKFGARVDAVPATGDQGAAAFFPRSTALLETELVRGSNLPAGLRWGHEVAWDTVGPGAGYGARLTFNGSNELKLDKIAIQVVGVGSGDFATLSSPFPRFDNKGRAFVDFKTPLSRSVEPGFRNVAAAVSDASGVSALLRVSFRVLPKVWFDPVMPYGLRNTAKGLKIRLPIHVMNRSSDRVKGQYSVVLPEGWKEEEGGDRNMTLKGFNSDARRVLQVIVPAGAKGSYPVTFVFDAGETKFQQTEWLAIGEPKPEKRK